MSASFVFSEANGGSQVIQDNIANLNFGDTDDHELTPASFPIVAGNNSYEKYIKAKFGDTFTEISNMKFWKSSGDYKTDEAIKVAAVNGSAYATPVKTTSSVATTACPLTEGTALAVLSAAGAATIGTAGYSQYIVLQLQTSASTPAGAVNQKEFTFQYDEV